MSIPEDARSVAWLREALEKPWARQPHANYVASIIPKGFAAYARILHPAYSIEPHQEVTWREVAHRFGQTAHAQMQWHAITKQLDPSGALPGLISPELGSLPEPQAQTLVEILGKHTNTADEVLIAIWEGWGVITPPEQGPHFRHFELPSRGFYLFQAPLATAAASLSATPHHRQSANLWWPRDQAWCVATEIDLMWTYVGGSTACIAEVLADTRLEAWPATPDDHVDIAGDQINAPAS